MNHSETARMKQAWLFLACLAATIFSGGALASIEIDRTLTIPSDGLVAVENMAGSIEISTWDRDEVQIKGEAGDEVEDVDIRETANGVRVEVNNRSTRNIDGTELYLRVPVSARIEAMGVSADITVKGSKAETISLETVSGDLEVEANSSRIDLKSVSGEVEFRGTASRVTAESVSGDVTLIGPEGEIKASTVSGDLSMEARQVSRGHFETVSGEMHLELALSEDGRLSCDAMSGDIVLRLPASQQAHFTAQSYSGDINSDFGNAVSVSRGPGSSLDHLVGSGSAKIRLETFSGDISIRRK